MSWKNRSSPCKYLLKNIFNSDDAFGQENQKTEESSFSFSLVTVKSKETMNGQINVFLGQKEKRM